MINNNYFENSIKNSNYLLINSNYGEVKLRRITRGKGKQRTKKNIKSKRYSPS